MTTLFASKFTKYSLYQLPHVHNKAVCFAGKSTTLPVLAAIQRSDLSRFTMVCYLYGKCIIKHAQFCCALQNTQVSFCAIIATLQDCTPCLVSLVLILQIMKCERPFVRVLCNRRGISYAVHTVQISSLCSLMIVQMHHNVSLINLMHMALAMH